MADPWFFPCQSPDVHLAGTILDGVLRGAEAVKTHVRGYTIFGTGTFHFDERGESDEIVVNHRSLVAALVLAGPAAGEVAPGLAVSAGEPGSAGFESGAAPGDPPSAGAH
ncbi:hypothetical protein AB0F91_07905 [Amycolatopsis sp. NPDC023774]|uniref:hypothetical protein n=1 Tax=Amycolatopsis sp. NPDC023774 TaxID=3155015 RepID=UPI0033ED7A59